MRLCPTVISEALLKSLVEGPLLLEDLPEAHVFEIDSLCLPVEEVSLNLQQKLGHLYEDALGVLLDSTPRYGSIDRGIQIRKVAGHTLGELDFLIEDLDLERLVHLELAVKFYLAVEGAEGILLPGPDARDNYFRKLDKMRSHQLRLVRSHRHLLSDAYREREIEVQQLVQGCVFNHIAADRLVKAEFLSPKGRRGRWLHAEECVDYFGKDTVIEIIPKPLWPVPLEFLTEMKLAEWVMDEMLERCVMVRVGGENTPYFIAPNGYPENGFSRR
ncbi:MAG: DUF1853 family protein [Akkermansiaceae bacterium]